MTPGELEREIEDYIDRHGVSAVLDMIEHVCHEKADHLATNWQDRSTALTWRRGAAKVAKASTFNYPL